MRFAISIALAALTLIPLTLPAADALPPATCEGVRKYMTEELERYQDRVDSASKAYQEEQWRVETADSAASMEKLSKLFVTVQAASYDKNILQRTRQMDDNTKKLSPTQCYFKAKLSRAREGLDAGILTDEAVIKKEKENQDKQDELTNKSNGFRMTIPGEKEPISRALYLKKLSSTADRKERESLYQKFYPQRADKWLEWGFKDLVKSRNEEAKLAGYKNYYEYRFFRGLLNLKNYRTMVSDIKARLAPKVRKSLQAMGKRAQISSIEDWDLAYLRERESTGEINEFLKSVSETAVLDMAREFYSGLGISIDDYKFKMDLYPRAGKNTHAFAMSIVLPHVNEQKQVLPEPKPDIRFLANLKKPVKWNDISTVIHELGHAVHAAEVRQPLGIFRGIGSVETEAIAMATERMANSAEFLEASLPKFTGTPLDRLKPVFAKHLHASRVEQAFVLLRQIFFSDFEYEVYSNPTQDYGALWAKMHKDYWGVQISPSSAGWDVDHFVIAPVYVENYAIGLLMVEQLYDSMLRDFHASYHSMPLGDKLKKIYLSPGQEFNYLELTEKFTGRPLSATAALKLLN